jgi:hypothetical protein
MTLLVQAFGRVTGVEGERTALYQLCVTLAVLAVCLVFFCVDRGTLPVVSTIIAAVTGFWFGHRTGSRNGNGGGQ